MKMFKRLPIITLFILAFSACKKDDATEPKGEDKPTEPEFEQVDQYTKKYTNGMVEVTNYPIDMTRSNARLYDFYSFDEAKFTGNLRDEPPATWDIVFRSGVLVWLNNGEVEFNQEMNWYGNDSRVLVSGVNQSFEDVSAVSSGLNFNEAWSVGVTNEPTQKDYLFNWAWQVSNTETGEALYFEPAADRTYIFKLTDGRYVKFQFVNCMDTKAEDNSASSKTGFLSFRYIIAKAGSTDVKTN
ncbi:HmuY family protein [Mucilaginibacter sp. JRF]|uniref:HmuY family protein n=1 Tax=Mucilaginibacter sp. JRF TaxID=2780088 RepID=UPI0018813053|nr:HmuY family protein [Mucilaginibacter sp. JRF]MBE9586192.1 HmuY family protein [Mucilaginibacter sp. JRF]